MDAGRLSKKSLEDLPECKKLSSASREKGNELKRIIIVTLIRLKGNLSKLLG